MMLAFRYGGKNGPQFALQPSSDMIVVRTESDQLPVETALTTRARRALDNMEPIVDVPHAGVQVFAATKGGSAAAQRARSVLKKEPEVRFAGRALRDPKSKAPVI